MANAAITAEQVQAVVHRYWRALMDKSRGELEKLYTYDASVFNPFSQRTEPGRVSAARKEREYFETETIFRAEIVGPIEVLLPVENVAVAYYNFRWYATGMSEQIIGRRFAKGVREGRATMVLTTDFEGNVRILHEHLSDIWRDSIEDAGPPTGRLENRR
jgi:hypothetical protein